MHSWERPASWGRRTARTVLPMFALAVLPWLISCGVRPDSGITGTVLGPKGPLSVNLRVVDTASGQEAAEATSASNGIFFVRLPAGQYRVAFLRPRGGKSAKAPPAQIVTVPKHVIMRMTVRYGSPTDP